MAVRSVAIIGAGTTGISVFAQLVRGSESDVSSITLIDPNEPGAGPVFGDPDPDLLCNTSAGICSLLPQVPSDFTDHCAERGRPVADADYTPRAWVGEYARERFGRYFEVAGARGVKVDHERDLVRSIATTGRRYRLHLESGRLRSFSHVIVCVGVGEAIVPDGFAAYTSHPRWVPSPYPSARLRRRIGDTPSRVLVVGSGLSAVDAALLLCRDGHRVTMASRTGILPAVRSRILPSPRALPSLDGISGMDPDDPDLYRRLGRAVTEAVRTVGGPLPLRRQLSRGADPVRRLREEIALAEADLCHWQDIVLPLVDAVSAWTAGWHPSRRASVFAPVSSLMWRYLTSLALPNARKLSGHLDDGELELDVYDPARVRAHAKGFEVVSRDGRVRTYDHAVSGAGFELPVLHHDGAAVHLRNPPDKAVPVTALGGDLRPRPGIGEGNIWVVGPATHIHQPFANFLGSATRQAEIVARCVRGEAVP
ncbi:SidA/IucD/PvdA family monooxygenase [Streptomyces sp. TRM43335]|uniref:SidA/IucD/PvdA family monooxygenase n=1 Tax=Streptomyces taklimakanensis TaxID=2569853 RepID=A0A6G2B9Y6_9ACTN|nr:SidA/IucD/PvdA family monooxygenase [Streptomyces taklimakanensis]